MDIVVKQTGKNKLGQYFTPKIVADFMLNLADISPISKVLEPSCGEGVFLEILQQKGCHNLTAFEIDRNLANNFPFVRHESFVSAHLDEKFDLIIGNPPYIRWKNLEDELKSELATNLLWRKYCNSLCDYLYIFILKSVELLKEKGQLIFICPEYWMNTAHSASLRNYLVQNGYFEDIYHFNETPIFEGATVSTIIFKYVKSSQKTDKIKVSKFYAHKKLTSEILTSLRLQIPSKDAEYLNVPQFKTNERWLLQSDEIRKKLQKFETVCRKQYSPSTLSFFREEKLLYHTIGEVCDIGNGLVSGLDKAFQVNGDELNNAEKSATIDVLKAKDLRAFFAENITKYIFIQSGLSESEFEQTYPNYFLHFQKYKADLEKRYKYNREIKYWEWVFLRNLNLFSRTDKRIFVPCKERISNKNHFRFALVENGIFPTQDVTAIFKKPTTKESIEYIVAYLNHPVIFEWLKCNGVVKGNIVEFSEKPIASIPFRAINWNDNNEVLMHEFITTCVRKYLTTKNIQAVKEINTLFTQLFETEQCTSITPS